MGSELLAKLRHHAETHQTVYDMDRVRKALLQDAADAIDRLSIDNAALRARNAQLADECAAWRSAWDLQEDSGESYGDPAHAHATRGLWDGSDGLPPEPCHSCERFSRVRAARLHTGPIRDEERTRR